MKFSNAALTTAAIASTLCSASLGFVTPPPSGVAASRLNRGKSLTFTNSEDSTLQSATLSNGQSMPSPSSFTEMPEIGTDGLFHIKTPEQHKALLNAYPNKLIVVKVFAPWCKACKSVEPKFLAITKDEEYAGLPIVFASFTIAGNKDYVKSMGVIALPSMLFYAGAEGLQENFPCGPSKIPILKRKLKTFVNDYVDLKTNQLKIQLQPSDLVWDDDEDEPCAERSIVDTEAESTDLVVGGVAVSKHRMDRFREIPFFKDLSEDEFTDLLKKAKLRTWDAGSVIMREGKKGRTFYIIESGEVEIMVKTGQEDPLTVPSNYMGTTLNILDEGEYFGERALITGEPRAASVRTTTKTRCFAFDKDDIPKSSVLSGSGVATAQRLAQVNDKYGVDVSESTYLNKVQKQLSDSQLGSQIRGSVNRPQYMPGVDGDEEVTIDKEELSRQDTQIINILQRLRIVKYAARCFDYILQTRPSWSPGAKRRRSMLASKLTSGQKAEFRDVFKIMDTSGDGAVSLLELKRVMQSIGEQKTDEELLQMLQSGHDIDGTDIITYDDFMGIMAEAEFYKLFTDTFGSLDTENSGFVKAFELDRVLCGMRDFISDDRNMIIDVEDQDMMIDYEQFSRMLLGGELRTVAGKIKP